MKERIKRLLGFTLIFTLFACMVVTLPQQAAYAEESTTVEDTTPYMKTLDLKWDLKNNKTKSLTERFVAVGKKKITVKMTNYKITDAAEEGYKKATLTLTFNHTFRPTKKQVHKMANSNFCMVTGKVGGGKYFTVLDYTTGENLEIADNSHDVKVTSKWTDAKAKKYKDNDGCWVKLNPSSKIKITIVYPENYDGVCLGAGGYNSYKPIGIDSPFWEGTMKFDKTTYYKKGKTNSHWIQIK